MFTINYDLYNLLLNFNKKYHAKNNLFTDL